MPLATPNKCLVIKCRGPLLWKLDELSDQSEPVEIGICGPKVDITSI